jgi:hypothetical protein
LDQYIANAAAQAAGRPAHARPQTRPENNVWNRPGLGALTTVETDWGHFPAQALRERDRVRVRSGGYREITRIDRLLLDDAFLEHFPDAQPIQIEAGRIGYGLPKDPVLLAPGQVLAAGQGLPHGLNTARDLLRAGFGHRRPERLLTYVILEFDEPVDVCCAGLWLRVPTQALALDEDDDHDE